MTKPMLKAVLAAVLLASCATVPEGDAPPYEPGDALKMHREWFGAMSNVETQRLHRGCTLPPLLTTAPPTTLTNCQVRD